MAGELGPCCSWGLAAGYQPHPQVVDRGTTARSVSYTHLTLPTTPYV